MATCSMIGIIRNGGIEVTYCHYDGYLEGNGKILNTFYRDIKDIETLISKGSIYELETEIKDTYYMEDLKNSDIKLSLLHHEYYERDIKTWIGKSTKKYDMIHKMIEDVIKHHDKIDFAYLYHEKLGKWLYTEISGFEDTIIKGLNSDVKKE